MNRRYIILFFIGIILLLLFVASVFIIREPGVIDFDIRISRFFSLWRPVWLTQFFKTITALGSFTIAGFLAVFLSLIFWQSKKRVEALFMAVAIASVFLVDPLKVLISRERPVAAIIDFTPIKAVGSSFPSGHSILGTSIYGFLLVIVILELRGRVRIILASLLVLLIILIGISRIYLGAHFISDVIGGLLLGSAWCAFLTILFLYVLKLKNDPKS